MHVKSNIPQLSKTETAKKLASTYKNLAMLKQYVAIWNIPGESVSQADTASSESHSSPSLGFR